MKLGLQIGYWGAGPPAGALDQILEAERLGYDSVWTAESWGSDALTPLAWWGSHTTRLRLGTDLIQLSARTADGHRDGRAHAWTTSPAVGSCSGLGVSGPAGRRGLVRAAVPEAARPHPRVRRHHPPGAGPRGARRPTTGPHYPLPYPGGLGLGKPLKSITHPLRADLPIFLGAEGPKNVALAAEIADGWFPIFYSPAHDDMFRDPLEEGLARPGARRSPDDFEILADRHGRSSTTTSRPPPTCSSPMIALYVGGMGAQEMNFHFDVFCRLGYEAEAHKIQDLYLAGRKDEAVATVPADDGRGDLPHRPEGEDPRRPRGLEGVARDDHAHRRRQPRHDAHDGRAGPVAGAATTVRDDAALTLEEVRPQVALLTLQRPGQGNALDAALVDDLVDTLDAVDRDNSLRVLVLTGAGTDFCVGTETAERVPGATRRRAPPVATTRRGRCGSRSGWRSCCCGCGASSSRSSAQSRAGRSAPVSRSRS